MQNEKSKGARIFDEKEFFKKTGNEKDSLLQITIHKVCYTNTYNNKPHKKV